MSKVVQLALINSIPTSTMKELNKIQKKLFGRTTRKTPGRNKRGTEIFLKKNKQKGTLISDTRVRLNFKFHSNLNISVQKLKNIPTYYNFF